MDKAEGLNRKKGMGRKKDIFLSPGDVRSVGLRHDLALLSLAGKSPPTKALQPDPIKAFFPHGQLSFPGRCGGFFFLCTKVILEL